MKALKNREYLLLVCCLLGTQASAAQTSPSVAYQLRAKDFDTSDSAQLLVTVDAPANFGKVAVQFVAPPGFVVDPDTLNFDPQPGKRIIAVSVRRAGDAIGGEYSILAHATALPPGSGPPLAVDQLVTFTYIKRLKVKFYFLLGLAGFIVGYLLRIVTGVLKNIPAPAPVLPTGGAGQDGPITVFVKNHYYSVDFSVSLALAFVVLLYLMREGHPPDSAAAWYGALLTGIGLGFLTNNDLLARIRA
jgi:hypothetical protein